MQTTKNSMDQIKKRIVSHFKNRGLCDEYIADIKDYVSYIRQEDVSTYRDHLNFLKGRYLIFDDKC